MSTPRLISVIALLTIVAPRTLMAARTPGDWAAPAIIERDFFSDIISGANSVFGINTNAPVKPTQPVASPALQTTPHGHQTQQTTQAAITPVPTPTPGTLASDPQIATLTSTPDTSTIESSAPTSISDSVSSTTPTESSAPSTSSTDSSAPSSTSSDSSVPPSTSSTPTSSSTPTTSTTSTPSPTPTPTPVPTLTPEAKKPSSSSDVSGGGIAAGVILGLAFLGCLTYLIYACIPKYRRFRASRTADDQERGPRAAALDDDDDYIEEVKLGHERRQIQNRYEVPDDHTGNPTTMGLTASSTPPAPRRYEPPPLAYIPYKPPVSAAGRIPRKPVAGVSSRSEKPLPREPDVSPIDDDDDDGPSPVVVSTPVPSGIRQPTRKTRHFSGVMELPGS